MIHPGACVAVADLTARLVSTCRMWPVALMMLALTASPFSRSLTPDCPALVPPGVLNGPRPLQGLSMFVQNGLVDAIFPIPVAAGQPPRRWTGLCTGTCPLCQPPGEKGRWGASRPQPSEMGEMRTYLQGTRGGQNGPSRDSWDCSPK